MDVDQCSAAAAQFATGLSCYSDDRDAAVEWWRKAADQGHAEAQYLIGLCHHEKGTTVDKVSSVEWFRKAAAQGHAKAQYHLGCAHYLGHGVPVDHAAAVEWWCKAADQGHADAQGSIGLLCTRTPVHRRDDKAKAKRNPPGVRKTKPNGRTGRPQPQNNAPPQGQEHSTDQ